MAHKRLCQYLNIGKDEPKVSIISKKIIDKLKADILQCCSLGSNRDKFCDFTVTAGVTEFPCHRFVLSACSGFFETLLRSDMKERQEMRATIHGISPEIFKLILDVIYGSCEALEPDKMIDIWKAAHQLQIQFLISACESHFLKNMNVDNSYLIYTHAQLLQSPKVTSSVLNYMVQNFHALVQSENFVKINLEDFLQIIEKTNLQICSDFKIKAILKWCDAENKNSKTKSPKSAQDNTRLPFLGNLIQAVDLAKVTKECLACLLTNPFIQEDKIANSAINSQAAKNLVKYKDVQKSQWSNLGKKSCQDCKQSYFIGYSDSFSDYSNSDFF